jgi:hypothetical protein
MVVQYISETLCMFIFSFKSYDFSDKVAILTVNIMEFDSELSRRHFCNIFSDHAELLLH